MCSEAVCETCSCVWCPLGGDRDLSKIRDGPAQRGLRPSRISLGMLRSILFGGFSFFFFFKEKSYLRKKSKHFCVYPELYQAVVPFFFLFEQSSLIVGPGIKILTIHIMER